MYRRIANTVSLLVLLVTASLAAATPTFAQGAQQNETDLQFIKRMTASAKRTSAKAERLGETVKKAAERESRVSLQREDNNGQQDLYGSPNRATSRSKEESYRRAGRKLRSLQKRADKQLEELADMQRSLGSTEQLDRNPIEATIMRLERDVDAVEHDLRLGRY